MNGEKPRALVAIYSRTLASARAGRDAARTLEAMGYAVEVESIRPVLPLPYPVWLLLSMIPGISLPIRPSRTDPAHYEVLVLAFPKWSHHCPPVDGYLARHAGALPPTLLVVTYGGWDELRYLERYREMVSESGAAPLEGLAVKKKQVGKPHVAALIEGRLRAWRDG